MLRPLGYLGAALVGLAVAYFAIHDSGAHCPPRSGAEPKRVADSFVRALVAQNEDEAANYVSSDFDPANMPVASAPESVSRLLGNAKRSTIEKCSLGYLAIVGAPADDPCFVYELDSSGGGFLNVSRKMFPDGDFRVLLGCDDGAWRVKGTLRVDY